MKPLVIVPCYNESRSIAAVVGDLRRHFEQDEVLVVDDASSDGSDMLAKAAGAMVVSHPCNLGYLKSLQTGLYAALRLDRDVAIFFDGDGQHQAGDVPAAIACLAESGADLVIGSRFLDASRPYLAPLGRRLGMRFFSLLVRALTGETVTDTTSGFKVIRRTLMLPLASGNYADLHAEAILDLLLRGIKVVECPIEVRAREHGESMYGVADALLYPLRVIILIGIVLMGRGIGGGK